MSYLVFYVLTYLISSYLVSLPVILPYNPATNVVSVLGALIHTYAFCCSQTPNYLPFVLPCLLSSIAKVDEGACFLELCNGHS